MSEVRKEVRFQRKLMKNIAKELKINPLEVEYLVIEMGFALIIGTMQGKRDKVLNTMDEKIGENHDMMRIRNLINKNWEAGAVKE